MRIMIIFKGVFMEIREKELDELIDKLVKIEVKGSRAVDISCGK